MKKISILLFPIFPLLFINNVLADEVGKIGAQPKSSWEGAYIGLSVGYIDGNVAQVTEEGVALGIHAGYLFEENGFVIGAEVEGEVDSSDFANNIVTRDYAGKLKAKAGIAKDNFLISGHYGYAFAQHSFNLFPFPSEKVEDNGIIYGVGVDYLISDKFSIGLEYSKVEIDDVKFAAVINTLDFKYDTIKIRASSKF